MAEFILGIIVGALVVQGIWEIRQRRRRAEETNPEPGHPRYPRR